MISWRTELYFECDVIASYKCLRSLQLDQQDARTKFKMFKAAKKCGWQYNRREGTCICPECQKTLKTGENRNKEEIK